jgi:hypothetical protein
MAAGSNTGSLFMSSDGMPVRQVAPARRRNPAVHSISCRIPARVSRSFRPLCSLPGSRTCRGDGCARRSLSPPPRRPRTTLLPDIVLSDAAVVGPDPTAAPRRQFVDQHRVRGMDLDRYVLDATADRVVMPSAIGGPVRAFPCGGWDGASAAPSSRVRCCRKSSPSACSSAAPLPGSPRACRP